MFNTKYVNMNLVFRNILIFMYVDMYVTRIIPENNSHYEQSINTSNDLGLGDGDTDDLRLAEYCNKGGKYNEYYLYTRSNKDDPDMIEYGFKTTIKNSYYDAELPLNVIAHGWNDDKDSEPVKVIRKAFLKASDCNVIVLDWKREANDTYETSAKHTEEVGKALGKFIKWLIASAGGSLNRTHLVGFSLGAHVVGNAGRALSGLVQRITGLDPSGRLFHKQLKDKCIGKRDGKYVEIIHTDSAGLGLDSQVGHADFYPNGGYRLQPGCSTSTSANCSHLKAPSYFAASIEYKCNLFAKQCKNIKEAVQENCEGDPLRMGSNDFNKTGHGIYGLNTKEDWPYDDTEC